LTTNNPGFEVDPGGASRTFTCDPSKVPPNSSGELRVQSEQVTSDDFFSSGDSSPEFDGAPLPSGFFGNSHEVDTVVDRLTGTPAEFEANVVPVELVELSLASVDPITVTFGAFGPTASGQAGDDLVIAVDSTLVPNPFVENGVVVGYHPSKFGFVCVRNASAFNNVVYVPVAFRKTQVQVRTVVLDNVNAKFKRNFKKVLKDSGNVKTKLTLEPGLDLVGKTVTVSLPGIDLTFKIVKKNGKTELVNGGDPKTFKLATKYNSKRGTLTTTFKLKKADLSGLASLGIDNADNAKPGRIVLIPYEVIICDTKYVIDIETFYVSKLDKNGTAKGKLKAPK